jgi:hypothetical protein
VRTAAFPRFAGLEPTRIPSELDRLVEELRAELSDLRTAARGKWLVPDLSYSRNTRANALKLGELRMVAPAEDLSVYLPKATAADLGDKCGIARTVVGFGCTVVPAASQYVDGLSSVPMLGTCARAFYWTGDGQARGWRSTPLWDSRFRCLLRKSANQALTAATGNEDITWDVEDLDPYGMHSGSSATVTIPETGKYLLTVSFSCDQAGTYQLLQNATPIAGNAFAAVTETTIVRTMALSVGDVLKLQVNIAVNGNLFGTVANALFAVESLE